MLGGHSTDGLIRLTAVAIASMLVLSACGNNDDAATDDSGTMAEMDATESMDGESMDGESMEGTAAMDAMNMGDPTAIRADEVESAELAGGRFVLLDTRPQGFDDTMGAAWIARHDRGTTVTIELAGLQPDTNYISHVHADTCANNGGDHYQFEIGGAELPPNEIHLAFTSDAAGTGFMTAENDQVAGPEAVALVVHPAELIDNKIACVDFVQQ